MLNHAAGNASRPGAPGFEPVRLAFDGPPQFVDPSKVVAVGAEKAADERVLLLKAAAVQVERVLVDLVQDDDDGRVLAVPLGRSFRAETLDELEPILRVLVFGPLAPREHHEVDAAPRQEELMRWCMISWPRTSWPSPATSCRCSR